MAQFFSRPGISSGFQLDSTAEMADSSGGENVVNRFMDMSQTSHELTNEDYQRAWEEEKDPDIAKLRELAFDLQVQKGTKNKGPRSMIESAGFHHQICVESTTQKCLGYFLCHIFIHGIHVVSREGNKMKQCRQNAFEAACQKLSMPYLRIRATESYAKSLDASLTPFSSSPPRQSEFPTGTSRVGTVGLEQSLTKESNRKDLASRRKGNLCKPIEEFVILEPKNPASHKNVDATMRRSANMNEMLLEYEYFFDTDGVQCILRLENKILADVVGSSKSNARTAAAAKALQKLQESCWTIKTKETGPISTTISDTNIVTRDQLSQGMSSEANMKEFCQRVRKILEDYMSSDIEASLAFDLNFTAKEEKAIRREVGQVDLRADTTMRKGKKYLCAWRPYKKLFAFLKSVGGETKRYRLIPPKQPIQLTATENEGGSPSLPGASISDVNKQPGPHKSRSLSDNQHGAQTPGGIPLAEDWPPTSSDNWQHPDSVTPEGWISMDPSTSSSSSSHQQEGTTEHPGTSQNPLLPSGRDNGNSGTVGVEKSCPENEQMSPEFLRKIILLENVAIKTDRQILQDTANFNKLLMKIRYEKANVMNPMGPAYQVVCKFLLSQKIVAMVASTGKASALASVCQMAVEKMRKNCWCIRVKHCKDETDIVSRSEFCGGDPACDSKSALSHNQSHLMPAKAQGPGFSKEGQVFDQNKVKSFLETLVRSGNTQGLIFRDEFSEAEVLCIQNLCLKTKLHFNVFHKKTGKFYSLSRKWTAAELMKHLQDLGGESDDHKLFPPLGENGDTFLDTKSTSVTKMKIKVGHSNNLINPDQPSGAEVHDKNSGKNFALGSVLLESQGRNSRNSEGKSYLRGTPSGRLRGTGQASKRSEKSRPRNKGYKNQVAGKGATCSNKPRNTYDKYLGSGQRGRHSFNLGKTDYGYHGSNQGDGHTFRQRSSDTDYHGSGQGGNPFHILRYTDDYYGGSSHRESSSYQPGNTDEDYYDSSQREISSYRPGNTDDDYYDSGQRESSSYRPGNIDDDYYDSVHTESSCYRPGNTDDGYYDSRHRESSYYRPGNTDDDYYNSHQRESSSYQPGNTDDDYYGLGQRESSSHRPGNTDNAYYGSNGRDGHGYRPRSFNDGPNWGVDDIDRYSMRHDIRRKSNFLEKLRYEEEPMWGEDNCSPRKMRRKLQLDGFDEGYLY